MPKYSALELKAMADIVISDREKAGDKSFHLLIILSMQAHMTPAAVLDQIRSYTT